MPAAEWEVVEGDDAGHAKVAVAVEAWAVQRGRTEVVEVDEGVKIEIVVEGEVVAACSA